jgi:hypothetical protein
VPQHVGVNEKGEFRSHARPANMSAVITLHSSCGRQGCEGSYNRVTRPSRCVPLFVEEVTRNRVTTIKRKRGLANFQARVNGALMRDKRQPSLR